MSKKDLLDILYAERARLRDIYTLPGWTNWAIWAAIASILWVLLPYFEQDDYNVQNICLLIFCFFNGLLLLIIPKAIRTRKRTIWGKGGVNNRVGALFFVTFFISEMIFIVKADCVIVDITAQIALVILGILTLLYLSVFALSYIAGAITQKNNKYNWIWYIVLVPVIAVLLAALVRSKGSITWVDFKMAVLMSAVFILLPSVIIGHQETLQAIDNLIEETLLTDAPNEKLVLFKLDECVRGLRVGDFLYKEYANSFVTAKITLTENLEKLKEANAAQNWQCSDTIIADSLREVEYIQKMATYTLKIIKCSYGSQMDEKDSGAQMALDLLKDCLKLADIWLTIDRKERNVGDYSDYLNENLQEILNLKKYDRKYE